MILKKNPMTKLAPRLVAKRTLSAKAQGLAATQKIDVSNNPLGNVRNSTFDHLSMSPTLGLNEMQSMMTANDPNCKIYKFGFGQSPMPVPQCMVEKLKEYAHVKDYLPVQGLPHLRAAIAEHYNRNLLQDTEVSPERVIVTPGSKQSFFLLKLALSRHTEVLLPSPSWVSYCPQSTMVGRDVTWITTNIQNSWKIRPEDFEKHLMANEFRPRLLILNSPSNPTGVRYSKDELSELADVCRKYGVIVMSDEIYGDLCHGVDDMHYSIYDAYPEGTIITNGLSKNLGAGGWRVGYMIFPETMTNVLDAFFIAASETHTTVSAPVQHAACEAFENFQGEEIQNYLSVKRSILGALAEKSYDALKSIDGCDVVKPDGGFYIFPDFSNVAGIGKLIDRMEQLMDEEGKTEEMWDSKFSDYRFTFYDLPRNNYEFARLLLRESGVAGLAGSCFGRPPQELSMRLSYVDFDGGKILSDLDCTKMASGVMAEEEIDRLLHKHCGKTLEGMRVLADYMQNA